MPVKMSVHPCIQSGESRYLWSPETAPARIAKHQYYDLGTDVPGAGRLNSRNARCGNFPKTEEVLQRRQMCLGNKNNKRCFPLFDTLVALAALAACFRKV